MFTNPTITTALAQHRRREMLAEADATRAARQSRSAGSRAPRRRGVLRLAGMTPVTALIIVVTVIVALRAGAPAATAFALAAAAGAGGAGG